VQNHLKIKPRKTMRRARKDEALCTPKFVESFIGVETTVIIHAKIQTIQSLYLSKEFAQPLSN